MSKCLWSFDFWRIRLSKLVYLRKQTEMVEISIVKENRLNGTVSVWTMKSMKIYRIDGDLFCGDRNRRGTHSNRQYINYRHTEIAILPKTISEDLCNNFDPDAIEAIEEGKFFCFAEKPMIKERKKEWGFEKQQQKFVSNMTKGAETYMPIIVK